LEGEIESVRKNISGFKEKTRASEDAVAVLKYKISKAEKLNVEVVSKVNDSTRNEIAVLDNAILYLEKIRSEKNDSVVDKFKGFILEVLHSLGLKSFTNIYIDSKLRISYEQGGEKPVFSDITEGEQLRVKIALYLALVKLNSEYGVGNHPRILIIDSPGKEEADNKYFEGFIETLNVIENVIPPINNRRFE